LFTVTIAAPFASATTDPALQAALDAGRHPWLTWPDLTAELADVRSLYASEGDGLFWFDNDAPGANLAQALETVAHSDALGLVPADYDAPALAARWTTIGSASPSDRALFDLAVTVSAMRLLESVHRGRADPRLVGFDYDVSTKRLDLAKELHIARDGAGMRAAVAAAEPQFPVYHRLVKALADYRAIAAAEPAPVPPLARPLKKVVDGQAWAGVPALAARLRAYGDLPADAPPPRPDAAGTPIYEGALVAAVKRFQMRHILEQDGVVGAGTLATLNVPAAVRVRQIELALERERWLPEMRTQPLVFVNIPLFRLWAYDPDKPDEPLRMNIVAGRSVGHATPIFIDRMEYVIFRPYWSPPPSIVRSEIVPHARRDPGYLDRENIEIVASGDYGAPALAASPENLDKVLAGRLFMRQKPGERNSLGLAKFIFPNADNIYMHGTPAQSLFGRARRDFSHGCIRLENPAALAAWVLRDEPEWTPERIDAAMRGTRPTQVNLKEDLTVMLFYDTAYVDGHARVFFADDYYGHDAKLEKALSGGYPYPRKR
jgi:murein L,D-transpeptidase YcbB/YkuD